MFGAVRDDWRVVIGVISGGHFLSHFYRLSLPPLFPLLREEFGLNNAELGLVVSVLVIGGVLQAPVGNAVDRIGAKWVFVAGVGLTAAGIVLIGLGPTYPAILLLAVVSGVGQSAFHPADYALIDSVTEADVRGRAFSLHTFSGYAGYAAAPVVVGTLAFTAGWRIALFAVGGVGLLYAAFSAVALAPAYRTAMDAAEASDGAEAETETDRSMLSVFLRPGILAMVTFFLVTTFASRGLQSFTTVLAVDSFGLAESLGNTLLSVYFALGSIGVLIGGVLADRYDPGRVIAPTLVAGSAVLIVTVTGVVPISTLSLVGLFGLVGFFFSLIAPARDRLVTELSESGSTGQSFGIVFTGSTVGAVTGPALLGVVADAASITLTFVLIGVLYVVAGALAFALGRSRLASIPKGTPSRGD
jgi:MFS family permease